MASTAAAAIAATAPPSASPSGDPLPLLSPLSTASSPPKGFCTTGMMTECIQILRNCREAIPKDKGKVIIIEAVVEEDKNDKLEYVRLTLDMVTMAHTNNGKERTAKEWAYVLTNSGFSRHTLKPIKIGQSLIEAYP